MTKTQKKSLLNELNEGVTNPKYIQNGVLLKTKSSKHRARRVRRPLKRRPELPFAGKSKRRENSGDQSLGIHRAVPAHLTSTERVETRSSFLVRRRRDARQLKVARPQPRSLAPLADLEGQFVYK